MKTPGWFRRGAATTAVFTLFGPLVASLLVAALFVWGRSLAPAPQPELSGADLLLSGLLGAFLPQIGPGLITGLTMSFASPHIRSARGWMAWATLAALTLSVAAILTLLRANYAEAGFVPALVMVVALGIPAALGALAAAAVTLRLRPRPSMKPTSDVFA